MASPAKKRKRTPSFRIEYSGSEEKKKEVLDKMQQIRNFLTKKFDQPVGNLQALENLIETWFKQNMNSENDSIDIEQANIPSTYLKIAKKDANQNIFLCAEDSLKNFTDVVQSHARRCDHDLKIKRLTKRGHVVMANIKCDRTDNPHGMQWSSSPYLPNNEYLVNNRVNHGLICSGMLPSHYTKFVDGAGIGKINTEKRDKFFKSHVRHIEGEYKQSLETALAVEVSSYDGEKFENGEIDILTDARHGWRKNAKDTSVVAIGEKSHKVLSCQHVTKADDIVSQRHEKIGTERIYNYLEEENVDVSVHCHDRNLSINKYVREETLATNQNDVWHCVKSVKTALKKVSSGPKYSEGKTWSFQLSDKVEPVSTHIHWAVRNCDGNVQKVKSSLLNIVDHYKNNHSNCDETSRCKKDPNYEPSRIVISSSCAEKLLLGVIMKSNIYRYPEDYILCRETAYVESFNNVINIYQDKRIAFGDLQYNTRSHLAVMQWNENVDREYTSISNPRNPRTPRSVRGKKNYKAKTFQFRDNIWSRYINSMFGRRNRRR